jgi:hypothetical protein
MACGRVLEGGRVKGFFFLFFFCGLGDAVSFVNPTGGVGWFVQTGYWRAGTGRRSINRRSFGKHAFHSTNKARN